MACREPPPSEINQISWYQDKALSMMSLYEGDSLLPFSKWLNTFEYVANFISVPRNKMVEFFEVMVSDHIHIVVQRKDPDFNLSKLPYDKIINHYSNTLIPRKENIYRSCFIFRYQFEQEPIKYFANCLRILMKKCKYIGTNTQATITKRFLNGLREDVIKNYLSRTQYKTFDEMVAKAIEFEKVNLITYYRDYALLRIDIYNTKRDNEFYAWLNKFECVADTIDVPESKICKLFIEMVDNYVNYNVMQANPSVDFNKLSYDMLIHYYLRYFYPNEVELHRLRMFFRKQYEQETIENYAKNLKNLFNKCIFTSDLEKKLVEHFINGLRENEVKNHLRESNYESFDEMVASAIEFARVNLITYYRDRALLKIETYNERNEWKFYIWLNKFEYVADTIDVLESKICKLFIWMVDDYVNYNVMQANPSVDFNKLSYDKVIDYYLQFYSPNENNLHRKRSLFRHQYEQEQTKKYANFLQSYYYMGNLKLSNEKELNKRFLNGLRENDTRNYLEKFPNLSFDDLVKMTVNFEKGNLLTYYRDQALLMINIYIPRKEGLFYAWLNRFEYVADMIYVPYNKMVEFFKNMVYNDVHVLVKKTFPDENFFKYPYNELINYYLRFFSPNEVDLHRPRIFCRRQYELETIEHYAHDLQKLFNKCILTTDLVEKLCKHFINGLRENEVKNHLRETNYESFDEMLASAVKFAKFNLISYYRDRALSKMNIYFPRKEGLFYVWLNRFEYVAYVIDVPDSKMVALFIEMIDYITNQHVMCQSALFSVEFSKLSYDQIIEHYYSYFGFTDKNNFYYKRFDSRNQYEEESVEEYFIHLQYLCNMISFPSCHEHKQNLRSQFINGLYDVDIKSHLLFSDSLSLEDIVLTAFELEVKIDDFQTY